MHFYYVDPGLRNELGHHANSCRLITRELAALGIARTVFAHVGIEPALRQELAARPLFRQLTYWSTDPDPIAGWLTSFVKVAGDTFEDMRKLPLPQAEDIVYLNSAQAPQFMALVQWLRVIPKERLPHVMTEFGTHPGVDYEVIPTGLRVIQRDPRQDPRAVLYRYTASLLPQLDLSRLHLFTFEPMSSRLYSFVLKTAVDVLPLPQFAGTVPRSRVGHRPVTVSVLGHQRPDKGYALVPAVVAQLLDRRPDIALLIHNGAPDQMKSEQQQLRDLLPDHPQLIIDECLAGPELWAQLLDRSDLILCPYPVWRFASAYSAVAAEAIANAIPLVVPANTTLATLIARFGGCGTSFTRSDPTAIADAVIEAVDRFDELAGIAAQAASRWQDTMGPKNMVKSLLSYASPPAA